MSKLLPFEWVRLENVRIDLKDAYKVLLRCQRLAEAEGLMFPKHFRPIRKLERMSSKILKRIQCLEKTLT